MKELEIKIKSFLAKHSSEQAVDDDELMNLLNELITSEKLSSREKLELLKLQINGDLSLSKLAARTKFAESIKKQANFLQDLSDASARLNILDNLITKRGEKFIAILEESTKIIDNLKMWAMQLYLLGCDPRNFAEFLLNDLPRAMRMVVASARELAARNNFSQDLASVKNTSDSIVTRAKAANNPLFLQEAVKAQDHYGTTSLKHANLQAICDTVRREAQISIAHYYIACKNISNSHGTLKNNGMHTPDMLINKALALMGLTRADNTATDSKILGSAKYKKEISRQLALDEIFKIFNQSQTDMEKNYALDIFPTTPIELEVTLNKTLLSIPTDLRISRAVLEAVTGKWFPPQNTTTPTAVANNSSSSSSSTSTSSVATTSTTSATASRSSSSSSSTSFASNSSSSSTGKFFTSNSSSLNQNTNKQLIERFIRELHILLENVLIQPNNDTRLINLLTELADSKSLLSSAEKYTIFQHAHVKGKIRSLSRYVGRALYGKPIVTKKFVGFLIAVQNGLGISPMEIGIAMDDINAYKKLVFSRLETETLEESTKENIRQKFADFENECEQDSTLHKDMAMAVCRLTLKDQHNDYSQNDFIVSYYYKIADTCESLTEEEQQKLTSYAGAMFKYILTLSHEEKIATLKRCFDPKTNLGKIFREPCAKIALSLARVELSALNEDTEEEQDDDGDSRSCSPLPQ
jgi:hypothetical protein